MKKIAKLAVFGISAFLLMLAFAACHNSENNNGSSGLSYHSVFENSKHIGYSVSRGTADDSKIIIPSEYKGLPVIAIWDSGFQNFKTLTDVTIPSSVKYIDNYAFMGCTALTSVVIPDSVWFIGSSVFKDCTNLTDIVIPNSVTVITNSAFQNTGIWNNTPDNSVVYADKFAVGYKGTLGEVILKSDTVGLADNAFQNSGLTNIVIPNSVTHIGNAAFMDCDNLTSIVISNNIILSRGHEFTRCNNLSIYIEFKSQPIEWYADEFDWTYSKRPVVWGVSLSDCKTYVVSFTRGANSIENYDSVNGISAPFRQGYIFAGWSTNQDGIIADYSAANVHLAPNGTILYAIWL